MNTYRTNAVLAGVLYIIGTVSGFLSLTLSEPLREARDLFPSAAAHADQLTFAALLVLLMGLSLAMVPVVLYPVLRRHSEVLALGYIVFRGALETFNCLITAIAWLLILALAPLSAQAGAGAPGFQAAGTLLVKAGETGVLGIVFCLGALMFYTMLYRSRLVPRWIPVWGLAAVVPYLVAEFLVVFARLDPVSTPAVILFLPMALQEMVMAVWFIAKGFKPAASAARPGRSEANELLRAA